jgi:hypothetical protein
MGMHIYSKVTCFFILFMVCLMALTEAEILLRCVIGCHEDGGGIIFGQVCSILAFA